MAETDADLDKRVRASVRAEIGVAFDELRRFVDRRIAELSAEIHATVQLMDFSETNLTGQLTRIHEQIGKLVAAPVASARNSGLELEAVVQTTEAAANRIMEAAEAIGDWLHAGSDPRSVEAVSERVNAIFEACTFQDLTGQRVRRAIEHLQQVESMLGTLAGMPEEAQTQAVPREPEATPAGPDLGQDDVDRMFG